MNLYFFLSLSYFPYSVEENEDKEEKELDFDDDDDDIARELNNDDEYMSYESTGTLKKSEESRDENGKESLIRRVSQ